MDNEKAGERMAELVEKLGDTIADRIVALLNEMLELDRQATEQLIFGPYVPCNEALADHPSIQVRKLKEEDAVGERKWGVRMMGLLNGLAGSYPDGWGRVAGVFEVVCEEHGITTGKEVVGDPCTKCSEPLKLGGLIRFERIPAEKHSVH